MVSPDRVMAITNGSAVTPATVCRSRLHRRDRAVTLKTKKSVKIRRWIITPLTHSTSMAIAAAPTIHCPTRPAPMWSV